MKLLRFRRQHAFGRPCCGVTKIPFFERRVAVAPEPPPFRCEHFVSHDRIACVFFNQGAMEKDVRRAEIAAEIERLLAELRPLRTALSSGDFSRLDEQKSREARLEALIEERETLERDA
jgi:hypothetical protein